LSIRNRSSGENVVEGEEPMRPFTYGACSMRVTLPISPGRLVGAAATLTTPLLPDDYLGYLNPLWWRREPRGIVDGVLPKAAASVSRSAIATCVGRLTSGAVRDLRTGEIERAEGQLVRTCCSAPGGAVEIEL
jgi:hypothetical protein